MWRHFLYLAISIGLLALAGAPAPATADPVGDVSRISISHDSFKMAGCDGVNSIVEFSFASTGTGSVAVTATNPDNAIIVGQVEQLVESSITHVKLPVLNGYTGQATITVTAAGYVVSPGQRGDQSAFDQYGTSIGLANCHLGAPVPNALQENSISDNISSFWNTHWMWIISLAVIVVVGATVIILRLLRV